VKVIRRSEESVPLRNPRNRVARELYFFHEKTTGVSHFHIEAQPDGTFPVDQAAGLLAMHCMVRGQSPSDYVVMVPAHPNLILDLNEKAEMLLQAGHSVTGPIKLTRREEEVLGGIMRSQSNKEIAATLNLSERTVKFHVSSLLSKFGVRGRMELVHEASRRAAPLTPMPLAIGPTETRHFPVRPHNVRRGGREVSVVPLAKFQVTA
jgi:DNA-binding CsgD family transcriptional regulator